MVSQNIRLFKKAEILGNYLLDFTTLSPSSNDIAQVVEDQDSKDGSARSGKEDVGDLVLVVAHPVVVSHGRPLELVLGEAPFLTGHLDGARGGRGRVF